MTATTYEPTPMARLDALQVIAPEGAGTTWFHFRCYDAVHDIVNRVVYIAQDDWLPEPGEPDPIQDEWPKVVSLVESLGYRIGHEPYHDEVEDIWLWVIPFNLN